MTQAVNWLGAWHCHVLVRLRRAVHWARPAREGRTSGRVGAGGAEKALRRSDDETTGEPRLAGARHNER